MEGPEKGRGAVSAGGDLLPVRGGSIYGACGPRDAGKNLPGDGRLYGRPGVELAARDGAQGPLCAGRLRLKMPAGPPWLPRSGSQVPQIEVRRPEPALDTRKRASRRRP